MQNTLVAPVVERTVEDLDPTLAELGDSTILDAVRSTKVAKVRSVRNANQNRAWSLGGNVD